MPSQIQNGFDNHADADPVSAKNDKDDGELKSVNAPTLF
jgi:hypothetical protein